MSAKRIASLLAAGTEILYALGLGDAVVAVSHECDHPPDVLGKPRVTRANIAIDASSSNIDSQVRAAAAAGRPLYEIDVDLLASLTPDLVITQSQCEVCAVSYDRVAQAIHGCPALGSAKVVSLNSRSLEGVYDDVLRVGEAAGHLDAARSLIGSLRHRVEAVRHRTQTLRDSKRPRSVGIEWIDPPMIAGNWMPELIEWAGGVCGLTVAGQESTYATWMDVVQYDPQVVVVMPCGFKLARTLREASNLHYLPGWGDLSAVRMGRVYAVDGNAYFNRSGPRLVDSLELLAGLIRPRLFDSFLFEFREAHCRIRESPDTALGSPVVA